MYLAQEIVRKPQLSLHGVNVVRLPLRHSLLFVVCFAIGGFAMADPQQPVAPKRLGTQLDRTPVTDPELYRTENVQRIKLLEEEYCAPRISSLVVYQAQTSDRPRGAEVVLDPLTLTNLDNAVWRNGKPNPNWGRGMIVGVTPSRVEWGFPGVLKLRTGKALDEIAETDLSTLDEVRRSILDEPKRPPGSRVLTRAFIVKLGGELVLLEWQTNGVFHLTYAVADGIVGHSQLPDAYVGNLEHLQRVARNFFRPCRLIDVVRQPQ
jgi:hypothetical protein